MSTNRLSLLPLALLLTGALLLIGALLLTGALLSTAVLATPVTLTHQGLQLNANIIEHSNKKQRFFVILHGTLAWHGMELPTAIATLLQEEEHGSLAFSLGYGISDRQGFYDCNQPMVSGHDDAQAEIDGWINYLRQQGYENIVLVGHSRGGAQMASYALQHPDKIKQTVLIGPMVWDKSRVSQRFKKQTGKMLDTVLQHFSTQKPPQLLSHQQVLHCKDSQVSPRVFASYYSALPQKNSPTLLANIAVPTTVYLGSNDPLTVQVLKQKGLFDHNAKVKVNIIDGADHFFRDFYIDEIVSDMLE
ncbi:MAG: pimeloyl-ACP methyl ester carboxylesterase [Phenylobacterium sp.]|jgi:pimeloyl-ACP methyl ester carboxylesterase